MRARSVGSNLGGRAGNDPRVRAAYEAKLTSGRAELREERGYGRGATTRKLLDSFLHCKPSRSCQNTKLVRFAVGNDRANKVRRW